MIHIVIGVAALAWGMSMMGPDWMFTSEILKLVGCALLIGFGVVAVTAGIRKLRTPN